MWPNPHHTREEIKRRATLRAQQEAQERRALIENRRVERLEAEFIRSYLADIEAMLAEAAREEA